MRLKWSLPMMLDIDGGSLTVGLAGRRNDCIFYQSSDSWNNRNSRDEGMQLCRKEGKRDICVACQIFDKREQIDVYKYGIDTL